MDRVLQRVGLVKRTAGTTADCSTPSADPRRRRPKTRRRSTAQSKTKSSGGGLFNFDWDYVRECRSCKSRALLGRRFCYKKCDNALYRSNSFKFERFERSSGASETTGTGFERATCTLSKQIAVCDHYSIPADDLCKTDTEPQHTSARSLVPSISGPALSDWNISSSNEEKVDILETYSTPRDNRVLHIQLPQNDVKYFTSPEREYSQPYTTDKSSGPVSDDDFFGCPDQSSILCKLSDLNSPDSISEALPSTNLLQTPVKSTPRKQPSPYYYSDLLNKPAAELTKAPTETSKASLPCFKKRSTLDAPHSSNHGQRAAAATSYHKKYRRSLPPEDRLYQASAKLLYSRSQKRPALPPCSYLLSVDAPLGDEEDEMSRQRRHVYETAFDSRISKSDDDLDQIDRISNHPVLHNSQQTPSTSFAHKLCSYSLGRRKLRLQAEQQAAVNALSQKLQGMQLPNAAVPAASSRYNTSPPSTAPLPVKFIDKEFIMNSIRSTPNLPSNSRGCYRDNSVTLPTKLFANGPKMRSNEIKEKSPNSSNSACDLQYPESSKALVGRSKTSLGVSPMPRADIKEIKDRPRKKQHTLLPSMMKLRSKDRAKSKRAPKHKYSSTESMTTVSTSSDGSMESIKSSTSEGNRSTTSTDSRHSCSISSHDSDSGALNSFLLAQPSAAHQNQAQLHILSPISDKSSQEPFSETSDNNRNNNEGAGSAGADAKAQRRRVAQNKNLLNIGCFRHKDSHHEAGQGSDSGISIQSREGMLLSVRPADSHSTAKVRDCTSDSATSIDFGELPFDMPKLRRRLRVQQNDAFSMSQASSSQSVAEGHRQSAAPRPKLSLNLCGPCRITSASGAAGLALTGLKSSGSAKSPQQEQRNIVDVSLPLEKQAWFHGAITRVEAENVLRLLEEGSFLVRNSESTKQDYSLSLKSARGYMHMRIQRSETEVNGLKSFILGQFSKPFSSIPEMIRHFSLNGLPIRGAEHMCLIQPVIAQLL